jgi:hypothetical protein
LSTETDQEHPCLPGGLIALEQWQAPETSIRKTLRTGVRDILDQLRASIHPEEQAFRSLDDLPLLTPDRLRQYAPPPDAAEVTRAILAQLETREALRGRSVSFLVVPPFSGLASSLADSGRRVITPPDNLLLSEQDARSWWQRQLSGDHWVIPELADFWLRHRSGLSLLKELFALLASDKAGTGLIGCSSWCWQFWANYLPELPVAPVTPAPLDGERLVRWLDHLARSQTGQSLTVRMTHDGLYVLPAPEQAGQIKYSSFAQDLASLARGNPGVALAIWRRALRARPEAESEGDDVKSEGDLEAVTSSGPGCWVAPLDQLSLPAVPQSVGRHSSHVLHALLLHEGLSEEQLALVTGLSHREVDLTLGRCQRAELVTVADTGTYFHVTPLGYPAVRKYLLSRGYPADGFGE